MKRNNILLHGLTCAFSQIFLLYYFFMNIVKENLGMLAAPANDFKLTIAQIICALILHLALQNKLQNGLEEMKYALNNANKFQSYKVAFFGGFVQASVIFLVETRPNYSFITLLKKVWLASCIFTTMPVLFCLSFSLL